MFNSLGQSGVGHLASDDGGCPEVIEGAQDLVVPVIRMGQKEVFPIRRLARAESAEEMALEQVLLARATSCL